MDLKVFGKILYLPTWANFSAIGQISLLQMTKFWNQSSQAIILELHHTPISILFYLGKATGNQFKPVQNQFIIIFQVVIVGNGAVGKSSMIQRYCKGNFTQNYKKTIGVDFLEKHITWVPTTTTTTTSSIKFFRVKHFLSWNVIWLLRSCRQCDQIWRNFTILLKNLVILRSFIFYWAIFWVYFDKFFRYWAIFIVENGQKWNTI